MNLPDGYFLQDKKYQLTHTIGQGGFGITYLGLWDTVVKGGLGAIKTRVPVCIKEYFFKDNCYRDKETQSVRIHSATGEKIFDKFKEKLIKEAGILSEVHHPYIVNVLEVFEENNTAYIVMEYITGCSLKYMLDREGVLLEDKVLKYTHQIGNALAFVHEKNIVHLDIKPSNILIDRDDNARLIDFGVSKRYDVDEQVTSTTTLTLSKGFASIEQYDNEGTQSFSPCPDVYSLGATMYNILTSVIPVESILRATKKLPAPSSYNSNIAPKTEQAILKAMEVKPEHRFQTIKEMLAALDTPPYRPATNTLTETQWADDDATGTLHNLHTKSRGADDDRTVIAPLTTSKTPEVNVSGQSPVKKTKRKIVVLAATLLCLFVGYALYTYWLNGASTGGIDLPVLHIPPLTQLQATNETDSDTVSTVHNPTDNLSETPESTNGHTKPNNAEPPAGNEQNQTQPPASSKPNTPQDAQPKQGANSSGNNRLPDPEETPVSDRDYNNYMASGNTKMNNNNYAEAIKDFREAASRKSTAEVKANIDRCILELYNKPLFTLGNLKFVSNKKSNMYGAIDDKGREVIPCKYKSIDISNNGPLFYHTDGYYDLYDDKGNLKMEKYVIQ